MVKHIVSDMQAYLSYRCGELYDMLIYFGFSVFKYMIYLTERASYVFIRFCLAVLVPILW